MRTLQLITHAVLLGTALHAQNLPLDLPKRIATDANPAFEVATINRVILTSQDGPWLLAGVILLQRTPTSSPMPTDFMPSRA
jgi:hypothetical protein